MTAVSPRVSRLLAIALLILLLGVLWGAIARPLIGRLSASADAVLDAEAQLARFSRIAAATGPLRNRLDKIRAGQPGARGTLAAATPPLAAAELQAKAKRLVEAYGATLKSTQVLPAREEGAFRRVAVRIDMESDLEALQKIVHALETASPYLFVSNVEIRARPILAAMPAARRGPDLTVAFDLYGYMRAKP